MGRTKMKKNRADIMVNGVKVGSMPADSLPQPIKIDMAPLEPEKLEQFRKDWTEAMSKPQPPVFLVCEEPPIVEFVRRHFKENLGIELIGLRLVDGGLDSASIIDFQPLKPVEHLVVNFPIFLNFDRKYRPGGKKSKYTSKRELRRILRQIYGK